MNNKDILELHNALVGAREQLDYIKYLVEQITGQELPPLENNLWQHQVNTVNDGIVE